MTLTVAILAHKDLDRVAQLADYLVNSGLNLCIHIDANVEIEEFNRFFTSLSGHQNILWPTRVACEWGEFSLVQAELQIATETLARWPDTEHVMLMSGDSLPIRPVREFQAFLANQCDVDFIESVTVNKNNWITGGLGIERFTLRFPFSWKKQRKLFDLWVDIQRLLRIKRKNPTDLVPHIGSQWWCLSNATLSAIVNDPDRPTYDAYFSKTWIPDESYFQTLVRKHGVNIQSRSLLFTRFDHQGKPTAFYDDHADTLSDLDEFFVRKVWSGADLLYKHLLDNPSLRQNINGAETHLQTRLSLANDRRKSGRTGLRMQGREPSRWYERQPATSNTYRIFSSVSSLFPMFDDWVAERSEMQMHGQIFSTRKAYFKGDLDVGPGGLSASSKARDHDPEAFLGNLVWNTRKDGLGFQYEVCDTQEIQQFLSRDPNANLYFIRHGWVLKLMQQEFANEVNLGKKAAYYIQRERTFISLITGNKANCQSNIWNLGQVISNPSALLAKLQQDMSLEKAGAPVSLPLMADLNPLPDFIARLKNSGVDIDMTALDTSPVHLRKDLFQAAR